MHKHTFVIAIAAGVVALDQLTKWYVRQSIALYESIPVIDSFFHLTHVRNSGGAFSLMAGASEAVRVPFFLAAAALAIVALIYFVRQIPAQQRWLLFAVAGVLGGAIGNLIDRVMIGQVTDFLDVFWRGYHWPAFNVADMFISIGVGILLIHSLFAPSSDAETTTRPAAI